MENLINELNRMGKGWFILKLAEEKGVDIKTSTYYGTEEAMKTRINTYERTRNLHKEMLKHLLDNWNARISAGKPVVDNSELHRIAKLI